MSRKRKHRKRRKKHLAKPVIRIPGKPQHTGSPSGPLGVVVNLPVDGKPVGKSASGGSAGRSRSPSSRTPPDKPRFPSTHSPEPFSPRIRYEPVQNVCKLPGLPSSVIWGYTYDGLLVSEAHKRLRSGAWSGGGPFYVHSEKVTHSGFKDLRHELFGSGGTYSPGGVSPAPSARPNMPKPDPVAAFKLSDGYGLLGYNRTRPGNPVADLFVASKETHSDGLPSIPLGIGGLFPHGTDARGFPLHIPFRDIPGRIRAALGSFDRLARVAGKQYLNVVFGWAPFLRDLAKLFTAMQNMQSAIDKLIRENGRKIHRKATLVDELDVSGTSNSYGFPFANVYGAPPSWFPGSTYCTTVTRTKRRVWYSAAYRYWIPDTDSLVWRGRAVLALLGALPTPGALWDAMPWTWLTGWFGDLGDFYDSISPNAVDGLVQLYGYTMYYTLKEVTYSAVVTMPPVHVQTGSGLKHTDGCNTVFRSVQRTEEKIRGGGYNPFGPGLKLPTDLSAGQLAVLAALGLSRV